MRNIITVIIVLICIVFLSIGTVKGIKIGQLEILSISELKEKNQEVLDKIEQADELVSNIYPDNIYSLEENYEKYRIQKQKYKQLESIASESKQNVYETKQYDIGYLWRILGNYATKRKLSLGIDVKRSTTVENSYNINFTLSGQYVNISQFITDIENNSDLYFRIYNFKMVGNGSDGVTATFLVKNINLDASSTLQTTTVTENIDS